MAAADARPALRPTAAGLFWLAAVPALLATAINYGNNLLFALAFLMFAVWAQAAWACRRNLVDLSCRVLPPAPAFAGAALTVAASVDAGGRPRRQLALACGARSARGGAAIAGGTAGQGTTTGAAVDAGAATTTLQVDVPAGRRGRQPLAPLSLVSAWPLGLWRCRLPLPAQAALVWPAPAGNPALPGAAPNPAHRRTASADFQGLRAYAPGDPPRRINWRAYARREELAVNDFDGGEGGRALWLDIAHCAGDLEARLAQLAARVLAAEHAGREYGLRLGAAAGVPPGLGRAQREACLRRLALYGAEDAA
ncbi:MAG: DUF58 domain-containing protein [Rhodocyclaceae bacterium]|nr:DUF58 domain-containing protein [Rhodocyclaceae bacterium]